MGRLIKEPGYLFKFPMSKGRHGYAQWLEHGSAIIFKGSFSRDLCELEVIELPFAFRVTVYQDTPSKYGWVKVGKADIQEEFRGYPITAQRAIGTGDLFICDEHGARPATIEEVRGLEPQAVWNHIHIVERLEALINGNESKYYNLVRIVA